MAVIGSVAAPGRAAVRTTRTEHRFAYVDSLRAVAALLVVWMHSAEIFAPLAGGSWLWDVARTCDFGRIGVVAFFGVSGYLIPKSLDASRPDAGKVFAIRRFFRLFPAYWLSIPLGFAVLWWLFGRTISLGDLALNATMIPDAFHAKPVMGLYWTLEYELAFYGLCLVLFKLGWLHRTGTMAACAAVFLAAFVAGFGLLAVFHRQAPGDVAAMALNMALLCFGGLWRRRMEGELGGFERLVLSGALVLIWLAVPAACAWTIYGRGSQNPFFVHFPVSYAAGMALFMAMTSIARVRWRPLAWVGLTSYSLYLLHPIPLYLMHFAFERGAPGVHWPTAVLMLICAAFSIALAGVSFHVVEHPAVALGRKLTRHVAGEAQDEPRAARFRGVA